MKKNGAKKLTVEKVREIFRRAHASESSSSMADEFGVSSTTIRQIRDGVTWSHVTRPTVDDEPADASDSLEPADASDSLEPDGNIDTALKAWDRLTTMGPG